MRVAITGGIGSGKSHVCRLLAARGIEVYDSDAAAKRLMRTSATIRDGLVRLVGPGVYADDGRLNKPLLAQFLLASEANKQAVNAVVHPAVALDFMASGLEWLESAILFESRFDQRVAFSHIVCVSAPLEVRISRIVARDGISRQQAQEWTARQMPQEETIGRSDFEIVNDGHAPLEPQIDNLLATIEASRKHSHLLLNPKTEKQQ